LHEITLVPLKPVLKKLGGTIEWDEENKIVKILGEGTYCEIKPNKQDVSINNELVELEYPPTIIADILFVPVSFFGQAFDVEIGWDIEMNSILINSRVLEE
jgi:hypothetical protein